MSLKKMIALNILVLLICTTGVLGAKKIYCDLDDVKCTTQSAAKDYYYVIAGKKGLWESSDPLKPNQVEGRTSDLSIKSYNIELTGLLQCDLVFLKMDSKAQTMEYVIVCPRLTAVGECLVKGYAGDVYVDGKGQCKATRDRYKFIINTKYKKYFKNRKQYIHITDYEIRFEYYGKATYDCETKVFNGDKKKADAILGYMNRDWKTIEETIGNQMMTGLMSEYIKNINDELKVIPINELFYYEV